MNTPFEQRLVTLLTELFGPLGNTSGYATADLDRAEKRLGVCLPAVLRSCYEIAGKHRALRKGLQNLIPPGKLALRTFRPHKSRSKIDGLVFLMEYQHVCFSVIRQDLLGQDDPAVHQGNGDEDTLYDDWPSLSTFLLSTVCWNSMQLHTSGQCDDLDSAGYERIAQGLAFVQHGPIDPYQDTHAFQRGSVAASVFKEKGRKKFYLYVSAKNEKELRDFESEFGLALSMN